MNDIRCKDLRRSFCQKSKSFSLNLKALQVEEQSARELELENQLKIQKDLVQDLKNYQVIQISKLETLENELRACMNV